MNQSHVASIDPDPPATLQPASRQAIAAFIAVVLVVVTGSVALGVRHVVTHTSVADGAILCNLYTDYVTAITRSGFREQANRRYAAALLASTAARQPAVAQLAAEPVPQAALRLATVLDAPFATANDGYAAARAIAVRCDMDYRTGGFDGAGPEVQ